MHKGALAALLALALLVASCGDDDDAASTDADTSAETETETDTTDGGAEDGGEGEQASGGDDFCTGYQELLAGEPAPDVIRSLAEVAPEEGKAALETLAAGFESDAEGFFDTEEFGAAFAELGGVVIDECADDSIDVTAADYEFQGLPSEVAPGTYGINVANEGKEFHELIVLRKAEGATQSFEEILLLEEAEARELAVEVGNTFAAPGQSGSGLFELTEPGDYAAVCFIPVGTTPDAGQESSGPPHFTQGMISEFSVG